MRTRFSFPRCLGAALLLAAPGAQAAEDMPQSMTRPAESVTGPSTLQYPQTLREPVSETLFGERIADPYRWLENDVREDRAWRNG
jgi:prolyl oligopeptidase